METVYTSKENQGEDKDPSKQQVCGKEEICSKVSR